MLINIILQAFYSIIWKNYIFFIYSCNIGYIIYNKSNKIRTLMFLFVMKEKCLKVLYVIFIPNIAIAFINIRCWWQNISCAMIIKPMKVSNYSSVN